MTQIYYKRCHITFLFNIQRQCQVKKNRIQFLYRVQFIIFYQLSIQKNYPQLFYSQQLTKRVFSKQKTFFIVKIFDFPLFLFLTTCKVIKNHQVFLIILFIEHILNSLQSSQVVQSFKQITFGKIGLHTFLQSWPSKNFHQKVCNNAFNRIVNTVFKWDTFLLNQRQTFQQFDTCHSIFVNFCLSNCITFLHLAKKCSTSFIIYYHFFSIQKHSTKPKQDTPFHLIAFNS
eukprot:TRINITY_DN457_c0_g1_i18.p1 TRINITY_DN457_c0_g1~~TRINITY_DN457_c0_g1_i18.p1  ORF type:complete len:230 (+),score=-28.99 TRINITY_DN457_c0_g1_i18:1520-2209(+)